MSIYETQLNRYVYDIMQVEKMNETVFQETGKQMGEYHFLGEEDFQDIEKYIKEYSDNGISDNKLFWKNGMQETK